MTRRSPSRMWGARRLLATSVAVTVAVAAPVFAAPRAGGHAAELTVHADHTAAATFQLLAPADIDGKQLRDKGVPRSMLDPAGRYGAVFVYRGSRFVFGVVEDRE